MPVKSPSMLSNFATDIAVKSKIVNKPLQIRMDLNHVKNQVKHLQFKEENIERK